MIARLLVFLVALVSLSSPIRGEDNWKILLTQAKDETLELRDRIRAATEIGKLELKNKDDRRAVVVGLIDMLPGAWDALTLEVINDLDKFGDTGALPKLKEMAKSRNVVIPGRINTALIFVIESLEKRAKSELGNELK